MRSMRVMSFSIEVLMLAISKICSGGALHREKKEKKKGKDIKKK